jgi:xanthine dehydrogenase accessory factor
VVSADVLAATEKLVEGDRRGAVVTVIAGQGSGSKAVVDDSGAVIAGELPADSSESLLADAMSLMAREQSATLGYGATEVFFEVLIPRPTLFVFGAVHIAQELVQHASLLGFRTIVADPRAAFVTTDRFPEADELRVGWPNDVCDTESLDDRTFVVVLTHDRRFEDPLWPIVLPSAARYIGAMGSAKTTAKRAERLHRDGFGEEDIKRIHGPIGLNIGSRTAGETAVGIIGEMITERYLHDEPIELIGRPVRA